MNYKDFRILGLAGSLRRASFHRGILRAAHEVGPGWMSCESFDLSRIPYFNQDIEDEGTLEPVGELNAWCELNLPSQQIGKGQPRTTELLVEPHTEIVQRYSGRQTSPQTTQLVRALPPEAEGVE
jgi:hypothetical protein